MASNPDADHDFRSHPLRGYRKPPGIRDGAAFRAEQLRAQRKLSSAATGENDGRWPFDGFARGQDAAAAPKGESRKIPRDANLTTATIPEHQRTNEETGLPYPHEDDALQGRAVSHHGGGPGQFYVSYSRLPKEPHSAYPFFELDMRGGKNKTGTTLLQDHPMVHGGMRAGSDKRFRGKGGESFGLRVSTTVQCGPGTHMTHRQWVRPVHHAAEKKLGTLAVSTMEKSQSSPSFASVEDATLTPRSAAVAAASLSLTTPSLPSSPSKMKGAASPKVYTSRVFKTLPFGYQPTEEPKHLPSHPCRSGGSSTAVGQTHLEYLPVAPTSFAYTSGSSKLPEGPDSWMILSNRKTEVNGDMLDIDDANRSVKYGGKSRPGVAINMKGAAFTKNVRKTKIPTVENNRMVIDIPF